jgi:hypothetical protein
MNKGMERTYETGYTSAEHLLANMEVELQAITTYIAKYHFEEFKDIFQTFKLLPTNVMISNDLNKRSLKT